MFTCSRQVVLLVSAKAVGGHPPRWISTSCPVEGKRCRPQRSQSDGIPEAHPGRSSLGTQSWLRPTGPFKAPSVLSANTVNDPAPAFRARSSILTGPNVTGSCIQAPARRPRGERSEVSVPLSHEKTDSPGLAGRSFTRISSARSRQCPASRTEPQHDPGYMVGAWENRVGEPRQPQPFGAVIIEPRAADRHSGACLAGFLGRYTHVPRSLPVPSLGLIPWAESHPRPSRPTPLLDGVIGLVPCAQPGALHHRQEGISRGIGLASTGRATPDEMGCLRGTPPSQGVPGGGRGGGVRAVFRRGTRRG